MTEALTIIFAFVIFLIVLSKGYLAAIRPMSLMILILVSLIVGHVFALLISWLFSHVVTIVISLIIIGVIAILLFK